MSIFFDFKIFQNSASGGVNLFLRDDLKNFRPFLLKRFLFFIEIKVRKRNKSTTPAGSRIYFSLNIHSGPATPPSKGGENVY
jgi:hypothetical protein